MRDAVFTQSGIKSPTAATDDAMASQVSAELSPVSKRFDDSTYPPPASERGARVRASALLDQTQAIYYII